MVTRQFKNKYLSERLEEVHNNIFCTDSVGDVVNLFLHKPTEYRVVYDSIYDVYCIADANNSVHDSMAEIMFDSGYVRQFMTDDDINKINNYPRVPVGTGGQKYRHSHYATNVYFIFIPNNDSEENKNTLDSWYNIYIPISTGNIWIHNEEDFSPSGKLKDLYKKLKNLGELDYLNENNKTSSIKLHLKEF